MMSREDRLRELELLPVWQLRSPLVVYDAPIEQVSSVEEPLLELGVTSHVIETKTNPSQMAAAAQTLAMPVLKHLASDDGIWLFVLPNITMSANEKLLLQNIAKAMRIKLQFPEKTSSSVSMLEGLQPKVMVALGEAVAQVLLQTNESILSLRGRAHRFEGNTLIVTFDLLHLLANLSDKAKAWEDLRRALQIVHDLHK